MIRWVDVRSLCSSAAGWTASVAAVVTVTLGLIVVLAAAPTGGGFGPPGANAQPSAGTFTPEQSAGTDRTEVNGVTNGTCDVPGTADMPIDGYNAVVLGPGAFGPNPDAGIPDGLAIVSTDDVGLSTTEPIRFRFRASFRDLAEELNAPLLPGDYVVTFRCVNQFYGTVYQSFTATFTFTGGPPATAFKVTNPAPSDPPLVTSPSSTGVAESAPAPGSPSPDASVDPAASSSGSGEQNVVLVGLVVVIVLVLAGAVAYRSWRRRSPERS